MMLRVKLFAAAREAVGVEEVVIECSDAPQIREVRHLLVEQFPNLNVVVRHAMFAVNTNYAGDQTTVGENDEIACIPPVSGG